MGFVSNIIDGVKNISSTVGKVASALSGIPGIGGVASTVANGNIIITDAHAVNKSYPTFFDDMAKLGGKIN